jgi:putative ABC transport system permease protein
VSALHIKLLRDLARLWAQALAIALVIAAGIATLIVGMGAYDSLSQTRARYYEANAFADVFANVTRAPKALVPEIAAIEGVGSVEARITKIALLDIAGMKEPASATLVSLPDIGPQKLNRVYMRMGRLPEPGSENEAAISEGFATAHGFTPGSTFRVLMNGAQRTVRVTGIVLSPEFIYSLGPGDLMPDERRFGIIWMSEKTLAAAYNLNGAFSNIVVKLVPGASEANVIAAMDNILAPYGGQGAFGRKDQLSHAFLDSELLQLRAISEVLPPVFLLVAAFLVNMTLTRLIALEREQIGLLKALGYSSWAIALHYVEFASLIGVIGIVIGLSAGTWMGAWITTVYAKYYSFPFLIFSRDPSVYVIAAGVTFAAAMAGAVRAALSAARLPPAVAMLPPAPPHYRKMLSGWFDYAAIVHQSVVMTTRHLLRWPWRTSGGILGVALAVAVLVGSLWTFGSTEFLIDYTFFRSARQDASISFTGPKPMAALFSVARLPGVERAEPFRSVGVIIRNGPVERRTAINGRPNDSDLTRVVDTNGNLVSMPPSGLVISSALAGILHVRRGDSVEISLMEGDRRSIEVPVASVVESYIGLTAYMDIDALNRLVGEGAMISGANVSIDANAQDRLFAALKATPSASFIALEKVSLTRFRETLAQNIYVMVSVYVLFAGIIAFGVIYNFARISLSEQGRELASLRVLGFTRAEVAALLLGEIGAVVLIAQPIGWLIGYGIAVAAVRGFSTEIYRVPLVLGPNVYAWSSIVVIAAALISAVVVRRRVNRLDMVAVLKTRE